MLMCRRSLSCAVAIVVSLGLLCQIRGSGASATAPTDEAGTFAAVVQQIEGLPYQSAYAPAGIDSAFPGETVPNVAPAQDYTSGSIPGSPDSPTWPSNFTQVLITALDGAQMYGELAMHSGQHPAVLVVHGFNTHGYQSVIRWAAMLAANGYDVLAADQRDFSFEYNNGNSPDYGYPGPRQTFGWKESEDVLAAGQYLKSQKGVTSVGIVGFSEGAQNTILALGDDRTHVFSAGITFSGPADQDTQVYSTAQPANCQTPNCTYPATDALVSLVVPPYTYTDPCTVLSDDADYYTKTTGHTVTSYSIMAHESAMHVQPAISVPLLNFYSADDSLVNPIHAALMAAYERGSPLQRTLEVQHGEHAYFFDRWWQQMAILDYFHALLPADGGITTQATVNQTPGGSSFAGQEVAIPRMTHAQADGQLAPFICDTSQPPPGMTGVARLTKGWSAIDIPLANTGITSLSRLTGSVDAANQLGPNAAQAAATYSGGRWRVFVPGYSVDVPVAPSQGIFVLSRASDDWAPPGDIYDVSQPVTLRPGWNLVAAPWPIPGLTTDAIASQIGASRVSEIARYSGGAYQTYVPGSSQPLFINAGEGFWLLMKTGATWLPA